MYEILNSRKSFVAEFLNVNYEELLSRVVRNVDLPWLLRSLATKSSVIKKCLRITYDGQISVETISTMDPKVKMLNINDDEILLKIVNGMSELYMPYQVAKLYDLNGQKND